MDVQLLIADPDGNVQLPIVKEDIIWSTERRSAPGKLTFSVLKDGQLNFAEGAAVQLRVNNQPVFFGFVFQKKRDKGQLISVTAYDQLRYLKNKDTYVYENKSAAQFIQMLAADFSLQIGQIEDTGFIIPSRVEENQTLFDMIENALDLTLQNNKEMFVLYDEFGQLTLKNIANMQLDILIDAETGKNFDYTSSIDEQTYNQIKLTYENKDTGKREVFIAKDSSHINDWGLLQYFDTLQENENGAVKAEALLKLYNSKTRKLKISHAFGDVRVRAGSLVAVSLNLGDIIANTFMLVEKVSHTFKESEYFMDLTLRGGEFIV